MPRGEVVENRAGVGSVRPSAPMALDPTFVARTVFMTNDPRTMQKSGGSGISFGSATMKVTGHDDSTFKPPEPAVSAGGGTVGKTFGGIGKGCSPRPGATGFINGGTNSYIDGKSVAMMSYSAPTWPTTLPRRNTADGVLGEFPMAFKLQRSIGGNEAFPAVGPRSMLI